MSKISINSRKANIILDILIEEAKKKKIEIVAAIVSSDGALVAVRQTDNVLLTTKDMAIRKARLSVSQTNEGDFIADQASGISAIALVKDGLLLGGVGWSDTSLFEMGHDFTMHL